MPVGGCSSPHVRYYGTRADVPVVAVSPRYTTQDCSGCGFRVKQTLSMRTQICPSCGLVLDRDENAALNILAAALAVVAHLRTAGQVGTGSVSPEQVASGQTATTRCVRKGTSQTGWMKEESPVLLAGECQNKKNGPEKPVEATYFLGNRCSIP
jgi:predicted RNA-binding Zn-ribbon protein involved in translation (DUF1610 family)